MPAHKYRKRVETYDCLQYTGDNKAEVIAYASGKITENPDGSLTFELMPGFTCPVPVDDWVLIDLAGVYSIAAGATFDLYYQPGGAFTQGT